MQRIDEKTYIDDTLVTCAEYQLFIDEMREQGKYHQPDHWTSYEFPKGQAGEPILGVRHSDAVAFCEWLTQRNGNEWKFRLPGREEADAFSVKSAGSSPLGYWLRKGYRFTWVRPIATDAKMHEDDLKRVIIDARPRALANASDGDIASYAIRNIFNAFGFIRKLFSDLDCNRDYFHDYAHARDLARSFALALDSAHCYALALARTNIDDLKLGITGGYDLGHTYDLIQSLANRIVDILKLDLSREFSQDRDLALAHARALAHELTRDSDIAWEIYLDLFYIEERLAGRFPAYESIRLVKYREP